MIIEWLLKLGKALVAPVVWLITAIPGPPEWLVRLGLNAEHYQIPFGAGMVGNIIPVGPLLIIFVAMFVLAAAFQVVRLILWLLGLFHITGSSS